MFEMFEHCSVGSLLLECCLEASGVERLRQVLADTFAGKANGTLDKRSGSMLRFLGWTRRMGAWRPFLCRKGSSTTTSSA